MKLTEHKRQWVKNKVIEYCRSMECEVPNWLFLKKSEWQEWAAYQKSKLNRGRYRNASRYGGLCDHHNRVIAIFVKTYSTTEQLDRTIRHELVHYVRRYNHRSERFEQLMRDLKNGKLKA